VTRRGGRTDTELLGEARYHLSLAQEHAEADVESQRGIDAVCMRLAAGIESLSRLDAETREELFGRTWPAMWGMRNRIAHGYLLVETSIVRSTVERDIPSILATIDAALAGEDG
jgi:uncharacterized protein with HEPN domain